MDTFRRTLDQFRDLYQGMSPSQRGTLIIVPLLVIGAIGLLMYTNSGRSEEHLLAGKFFAPDELARAQEALRQAGLTEFRVEGQRIAVPTRDVEKYTAALVVNHSLPADFAADFDRMQEKIGLFTPESQRREMMEENRKLKLSKILRAIPDIEDAAIEWDRTKPTGFGQRQPTVTAQVSVLPRNGRELTPELVRSLRMFVAGAVAGLTQENVTVLDMSRGVVFAPPREGDPLYDPVLSLTKLRSAEYEAKIAQHLSYIPNVLVTAHVELDNMRHSVERQHVVEPKPVTVQSVNKTVTHQSNERPRRAEPGVNSNKPLSLNYTGGSERSDTSEETLESAINAPSIRNVEKTYEGLQPKSVQVAIAIPESFYRAVAIQRGIPEGTTDEAKAKFNAAVDAIRIATERDVAAQVATLIPAGSPPDSVSVKSIPSLEHERPVPQASLLEMAESLASQWGSTAALALFALWALWALQRSVPKPPPQPVPELAGVGGGAPGDLEEEEADEPPQPPTRRDELQSLVRENPEMAASVLSRWITPPAK